MKFYIKQVTSVEQTKNGLPIYSTGSGVFKVERAERNAERLDDTTVKYITGFSKEDIQRSPLLSPEEKEICIERLPEQVKKLEENYGAEVIKPTNNGFWGKDDKRFLRLDQPLFNVVFDDNELDGMILRQAIIANAFPQIAYKDTDKYKLPGKKYYLVEVEELEKKVYNDAHGSKLESMAKLFEIKRKKGKDLMVYLTWVLDDSLDKGFTRNSSETSLETYLVEFIEGKNVKAKKKDCAGQFLKAALEYDENKDAFMAKLTYRVAKHFNLIYTAKGKVYIRENKMELGTDEASSLRILTLPTNAEEFLNLNKAAMEKLNN